MLGLDTGDTLLFDSAWVADGCTFDLNGTVLSGLDAIHSDCYNHISKLDTTHTVSNIRINVEEGDNAKEASMTATGVAQHYREGEGLKPDAPRLLAGSQYMLDLVKDGKDGVWRIKHMKLKIVWAEGDWTIVAPEKNA